MVYLSKMAARVTENHQFSIFWSKTSACFDTFIVKPMILPPEVCSPMSMYLFDYLNNDNYGRLRRGTILLTVIFYVATPFKISIDDVPHFVFSYHILHFSSI